MCDANVAWHRAEVAVFVLACFCSNADVAFGDGYMRHFYLCDSLI